MKRSKKGQEEFNDEFKDELKDEFKDELKKAVALRYRPEHHAAPVIVAKGKGLVAEKMMEKAREHGIPIQEDKSLVEVLSKLEIEQQIPEQLYQLVAEILSFVYRSDQRASSMGGKS